jgi:hypothetical protein
VRPLFALALAATLIGCGSTATPPPSSASRTIELNWHEITAGAGDRFVFEVDRLVLAPHRWSARVSFTNDSRATFVINRVHRPQGWMFGLVLSKTARVDPFQEAPVLIAALVEPTLPTIVRPGTTWTGTMTGFRALPKGAFVRVAFGRFMTTNAVPAQLPARFIWVTDHVHRL